MLIHGGEEFGGDAFGERAESGHVSRVLTFWRQRHEVTWMFFSMEFVSCVLGISIHSLLNIWSLLAEQAL